MTGRDRLVLIAVVSFVVVVAAWVMLVSPQRKKAKEAAAEVTTAQAKLSTARGQLGTARAAQAKYAASYGSIVRLGKAVPTSEEVPSLIYELAQASKQRRVQFTSIASAATNSSSKEAEAAVAAGFKQMPFTFVFNGNYFGLENMLHRLDSFATRRTSGSLEVNGRLLTIKSVTLAPLTVQGHPSELTATVTATAYALAPEKAGASGEGEASKSSATSGASSSPSSPTAPAVVGARP